jgi:hypothetical protein
MSTNIPAVQDPNIRHCLLVDFVLDETTTYYISNAYQTLRYDGHDYTALGYFMSMSELQGDIKTTNNQISIGLSGIPSGLVGDPGFLNLALNSNIKGSRIRVFRAFFNDSLTTMNVYQRFYGYVSNYSLTETWDGAARLETQSVILQCSSLNGIIERQYTGRRTNDADQQLWFANDTGMNRVKSIAGANFDFGKKIAS